MAPTVGAVNSVDISRLTDDELLARVKFLARAERGAVCDLVEHLAELDKRRLHETLHYPSLFEYCVYSLGMSEGATYRRIRAARAIRLFPPISILLRDGRLPLESIALLHPYLQDPDAAKLIHQAAGLTTRKVQALVAGRCLEEPKRDVIRFCGTPPRTETAVSEPEAPLLALPAPACPSPLEATPPPQVQQPAAPSPRTIRVAFTVDEEFYKLLNHAQRLMRHKYPDGRLEGVLRDALVALIKKTDWSFRGRTGRRKPG